MEELEGHLRDQVAALTEAGLAGDEAFLVAVKRMGSLDALSREFARAHSERLWKQLVVAPDAADESANAARTETLVVLSLAVAAALAIKVPALFGLPLSPHDELPPFYAAERQPLRLAAADGLLSAGSAGRTLQAASGSRCPSRPGLCSPTSFPSELAATRRVLTALHLPIALWLAVGFAYVGSRWFAGGWAHGLRAVLGRAGHLLRAHRARRGRAHRLYVHDVLRHRDERRLVRRRAG